MPGTQREADSIKADFSGAAIYTGKNAQEATTKREAGAFRHLHFATLGLFNEDAPMETSIVLAEPPKGSPENGFLFGPTSCLCHLPHLLQMVLAQRRMTGPRTPHNCG